MELETTLCEMVAGLGEHHFADLDSPLPSFLEHGLFQGVIAAVTRLNPQISRSALLAGPSWRDVFSWLEDIEAGEAAADQSVRPPRGSYQSPATTLRPLAPDDVDSLYHASLDPRVTHRWRFRGRTPSPAEFHRLLFSPEVLCQYMVVEIETRRSVGLITAYEPDLVASHVRVAAQRLPGDETTESSKGLMVEGFFVFAQYLFDHFNFSKVYMEVPEYNLPILDTGQSAMLTIEGCLRRHHYYGDRYWDHYYLALYREAWESIAEYFRGVWPEGHFEPIKPGAKIERVEWSQP